MLEKVRKWYEGDYLAYRNDPDSPVFLVGGFEKRHWTSQVAHVAVDFYRREWKWVLGTMGALVAFLFFRK